MAEPELPEGVVQQAERLTRLARDAVDDDERAAYREHRADLLAEHGYACRVREDGPSATLVCYPGEWLDESGTVRFDAVEDTDRAVEVSLSGPGEPDEWDDVDAHNRDLVERVREAAGESHAANAAAFADFMGNHYAREVESATRGELEEFLDEYYPRNAWPSEEQRERVEESLRLLFRAADRELPLVDESRRDRN